MMEIYIYLWPCSDYEKMIWICGRGWDINLRKKTSLPHIKLIKD